MNTYELTVILAKDITSAKKKSFEEKVEKMAKNLKGKVEKTEEWGNIELEYPIKKQDAGSFVHFILELDSTSAKAVKDRLKPEDGIIRYLLIRKE